MDAERPVADAECLSRCEALLTQALELLSTKLTGAERAEGWTVPKQRQLRRLVDGWKAEVVAARRLINEAKARVMGRWFLDNGVEYGPISEVLARVDNAITDGKEGPWEERRNRRAVVPPEPRTTGHRPASPFFRRSMKD
jgi:hypothetical protein